MKPNFIVNTLLRLDVDKIFQQLSTKIKDLVQRSIPLLRELEEVGIFIKEEIGYRSSKDVEQHLAHIEAAKKRWTQE